jgi:prepilin-type N-terminal cleavage/methylation domain-containing protein
MKDRRGFTLIEVLVAASVLGIVATALFGLFGKSLSNLRKVEDLHRYELAAKDVMNRVLVMSSLPPSAVAQGVIDNLGATWTVNIAPWDPPTLEKKADQAVVKINVVVSWPGRSSQRSIELVSLRAAKIEAYDLQSRIQTAYAQQ